MKIIQVKKSFLAKLLGVNGIVVYPFIFFSDNDPSLELISHEMVHVGQIRQYGVIKFYYLYMKEYFYNRVCGMNHNDAYLAISFEKEAYENQDKIT